MDSKFITTLLAIVAAVAATFFGIAAIEGPSETNIGTAIAAALVCLGFVVQNWRLRENPEENELSGPQRHDMRLLYKLQEYLPYEVFIAWLKNNSVEQVHARTKLDQLHKFLEDWERNALRRFRDKDLDELLNRLIVGCGHFLETYLEVCEPFGDSLSHDRQRLWIRKNKGHRLHGEETKRLRDAGDDVVSVWESLMQLGRDKGIATGIT